MNSRPIGGLFSSEMNGRFQSQLFIIIFTFFFNYEMTFASRKMFALPTNNTCKNIGQTHTYADIYKIPIMYVSAITKHRNKINAPELSRR